MDSESQAWFREDEPCRQEYDPYGGGYDYGEEWRELPDEYLSPPLPEQHADMYYAGEYDDGYRYAGPYNPAYDGGFQPNPEVDGPYFDGYFTGEEWDGLAFDDAEYDEFHFDDYGDAEIPGPYYPE